MPRLLQWVLLLFALRTVNPVAVRDVCAEALSKNTVFYLSLCKCAQIRLCIAGDVTEILKVDFHLKITCPRLFGGEFVFLASDAWMWKPRERILKSQIRCQWREVLMMVVVIHLENCGTLFCKNNTLYFSLNSSTASEFNVPLNVCFKR